MRVFYTWLLRVASIRFLIIWIIVYGLYLGCLMIPMSNGLIGSSDAQVIDLIHFINEDGIYDSLAAYGQEGRSLYLSSWYLDFIYPFIYMVLMYTLLGLSFRRINLSVQKGVIWMFLPFIAVVVDYAENISFLALISNYPHKNAGWIVSAMSFNGLKWIVVYLVVIRFLGTFFQKKKA